jgi:branched-chain amino acid transport system substrate-binding protein
MIKRRAAAQILASATLSAAILAAVGGTALRPAYAADKVIKVGLDVSLTGADAAGAIKVAAAAQMAFDQANDSNAIPGYKIEVLKLDDGTATAGQYDPAQAAINARKFVSDPAVVAAVGPEMSGAAKAMTPILSQGNLAIITPSATNPAMTDPKFADQYKPSGKTIFFRTVTTDAFQGPNMANYMAEVLKIKSVYVLDDSGAYGVGLADAFQAQVEKKGVKILGRDRLDPKAADYTAILTKIKQLNPDALYYGGVGQAGVKLVKQAYDIVPNMIKAGGDGMYATEVLTAGGFPAAEGWYATIASPHLAGDTKVAEFTKLFQAKYNLQPDDYSITAYDAALVIVDAIKKIAATGKPVTRDAVRDAIEKAKTPTLQGTVSFDANGDLLDRTVSVFQIKQDKSAKPDDMDKQYRYIAVAPQS